MAHGCHARPPNLKSSSFRAVIFNAPALRCLSTVDVRVWEAVTGTNRDFASLLDDLFVVTETPEETAPRPTIPFDYLAVAEELHSGRIKVSREAAAAEYRAAGVGIEAELSALLAEVGFEKTPAAPDAGELLPIEPEAIAAELGLANADPTDFGRLRRAFALNNHPDRVAPHLRQRALARMQVANGLIDEAKRKALAKTRR
ncbi:hypothetical protein [Mesorhizobium sp. KR9-304]|uniref:hypothetical protein n=1 Tax=Mesorhizobium sp. KR9-304 TaxID=3156614 RepID=UPI0032B453D4